MIILEKTVGLIRRMSWFAQAAGLTGLLLALSACGSATEGLTGTGEEHPSLTGVEAQRCAPTAEPTAGQHWISSWRTAPTDALITHPISGLTVRQSFAPHRGGERVRLRVSNRYASVPVTLESVHVARERAPGEAALVPGTACQLLFGGASRITLAPGESMLSDAIVYPVRAFERLSVSFYAPEFTPQITRHLGAAEVLYLSVPGNYAADPSEAAFDPVPDGYASNFLAIESLEVIAPQSASVLVAAGDSITDGSGSTTAFLQGGGNPMTATDQRYPNHLQRQLNAAGIALSVANAGIGGNELLNAATLPQFGPRLLDRLDHDVLAIPGASHVLVMIGTNDLGNPKLGAMPTADDLIAGLTTLIDGSFRIRS